MPTRFAVVCDDDQAEAVTELARRHGTTEQEVIEQLIETGLEAVEEAS